MFYFVYRTTNIANGKIYIGVHQTENLNDGYLGSGKAISRAIKKYGKQSFVREILETFSSRADADDREAELVDVDFIRQNDNYNLVPGGSGGSIVTNRKSFTGKHTSETKAKISKSLSGQRRSQEIKQKLSESNWAHTRPEEHRAHAQLAGHLSQLARSNTPEKREENSRKISEGLRLYFAENGSSVTGMTRPRIVCPHCGKDGANNTMSRWHFDNCRHKTNSMVKVA